MLDSDHHHQHADPPAGTPTATHHNSPVDKQPGPASRDPSPNLDFAQYVSPYDRARTSMPQYSKRTPVSTTHSWSQAQCSKTQLDYLLSDVMEALMEEDMSRLRARQRGESLVGALAVCSLGFAMAKCIY